MKVLERAITPNGVNIQIEDWSQNYSFFKFGNIVATYPKATQTASNGYYPKFKETFRLEFWCENCIQTKEIFEALKNGTKTLKDYASFIRDIQYLDFI